MEGRIIPCGALEAIGSAKQQRRNTGSRSSTVVNRMPVVFCLTQPLLFIFALLLAGAPTSFARETSPVTVTYTSNPLNQLTQKSGADPPRKVVFSGGVSVREYEGTNPQALTVEYVRGSDMGGGVGGILYTLRNGAPSFTHYNNRGDVTAKTDGTGELTWQASYEAFGTRRIETGDTLDRQKANTKEEDPTGLLNEGFRYRDLDTGVFLTRDPAGFVDGPNLYTYVQQNPWSKFDSEGLAWSAVITAGFAAYDTYQYATGQTSGQEYAAAMALNGAALVADVATAGQGGGLVVRAASIGARTAKAAVATAKVVDKANNIVQSAKATGEGAEAAVEAANDGDTAGAVRAFGRVAVDTVMGLKSRKGAATSGPYRGGSHREMTRSTGDGLDSHHMPDRGANPSVNAGDGPAIQMDPLDHRATSSYGGGRAATQYRAETAEMIQKGKYRNAMAREIKDVRRSAGETSGNRTKYNNAMQEMLDYSRSSGQLPATRNR